MKEWRVDIVELPVRDDGERHVWVGEASTFGEALGKAWGEAMKTTVADALESAADKLRGGQT